MFFVLASGIHSRRARDFFMALILERYVSNAERGRERERERKGALARCVPSFFFFFSFLLTAHPTDFLDIESTRITRHVTRDPRLLTSCVGIMCRARREFFLSQNCNICSVLSTFKYNQSKTNNKFITSQ